MLQIRLPCCALAFITIILVLSPKFASCDTSESIRISANGTIYPVTAPITSNDNITYSFTGNIYNSIIIEKDDIVIDGCGYTLQGSKIPYIIGLELSGRDNIIVRNLRIVEFGIAVGLWQSYNITLQGNHIGNNVFYGFDIWNSTSIRIRENDIVKNQIGVKIEVSALNTITLNNIEDNKFGIHIFESSDNYIHRNQFVNNLAQVSLEFAGSNFWDDGYPSGGNYWSDFSDIYPDPSDEYRGPSQDQLGSDGFWDNPYTIDENNKDNYPVVRELPSPFLEFFFVAMIFLIILCLIIIQIVSARRKV